MMTPSHAMQANRADRLSSFNEFDPSSAAAIASARGSSSCSTSDPSLKLGAPARGEACSSRGGRMASSYRGSPKMPYSGCDFS